MQFCWPLLDVTSTGLRRTPSPRFTFGQACLQPSNFLSHTRHQTHHTACHVGIVDTLLLLHEHTHDTKTTRTHLHLLACHIPLGWCWARVVNSPTVPLDQHGHQGKPTVFEATSDGKRSGVRSNIRRDKFRCSKQHQTGKIQVFEATSDGKIQVFEATSDGKYVGVRSNIRHDPKENG